MKPLRISLFLFFFCFGACSCLFSQVDTTQLNPAIQADTSMLSRLLDNLTQAYDDGKSKDSIYLNLSDSIIKISPSLADTAAWIRGLSAKSYWLKNHEQENEALKLDSARKILNGLWGFTMRKNLNSSNNDFEYNSLYWTLQIFVDSSAELTFDSIRSPAFIQKFEPNYSEDQELDSSFAYWVRVRLKGNGKSFQENVLLPNTFFTLWKDVSFFRQGRKGEWHQHDGGASVPASERMTTDWADFYKINLDPDDNLYVYFRLHGFKEYNKPEWIGFRHGHLAYLHTKQSSNTRVYAFIGILLFQVLFYFFWYLTSGERTFIPYIFYILGIAAIAIISIHFMYWFPFPDFDRSLFRDFFYLIGTYISGTSMVRFTQMFLDSRTRVPKWHRILNIFLYIFSGGIFLILILFGLELSNADIKHEGLQSFLEAVGQPLISLFIICLIVGLILISISSYLVWRKNFKPAIFYLIALSALVIGVGAVALSPAFGIDFLDTYDEYMILLQTGILLQLCFFALGLGNKRSLLEKEKLAAQDQLLKEQNKVNTAFGRFVPHNFLKAIGRDSVLDIKLGDGVEQEVSVFFSDIRGYTQLSEHMNPKENFRFLNGYLGRMGPIITENAGFVNQYYGDGIMAIFMQKPEDAIKASIRIQHRLKSYNEERRAKDRAPIKIGIGLHAGPLMMGIIGDTLRMDASVVSDTVNTASRMEGLTKHFGVEILVSETIFQGIKDADQFRMRYLGKVQVKGRNEPLKVYDFFDGDERELIDKKSQTLQDFNTGIKAFYEKDFPTSIRAFERVLEVLENDKSSLYYLEWAKECLLEGVGESWSGIVEMTMK